MRGSTNSRIYILRCFFYLFLSCDSFLNFWHGNLLLLHHLLDLLLILHLLVIKQSLKLFRSKLCGIKHLRNTSINVRILNDDHPRISNLNWNSITLLIQLVNKFIYNLYLFHIFFIMAIERIENFLLILLIIFIIFLLIIDINIRLSILLKYHLLPQVLLILVLIVVFEYILWFIIFLILNNLHILSLAIFALRMVSFNNNLIRLNSLAVF